MSTSGAVNATGITVSLDLTIPGSSYAVIGGQLSHSLTLNNNTIDITNKSSASFREILGDEGTQSIDLSVELLFNSNSTYDDFRALAGNKALASFRVTVGGNNIDFVGIINSWADSSPDGDKFSASVQIMSSGSFVWN